MAFPEARRRQVEKISEGDELFITASQVHGRNPYSRGLRPAGPVSLASQAHCGHVVEAALDLTGAAEGRLHGRFPSIDGDWLGVVNYEIGYADGAS
ncbi:hypothetical protein [Lentzea sp. E54]|uniref:hypothetical protein n=1 Tax=Lentzea xerophila TaxID=3435883 RepID=UPI003DA3B4C7